MAAEKKKGAFINNVATPIGRISYPHLAKPDEGGQYSDGKYKLTLLLPKKGVDMEGLKKAALLCAQQAFGAKITSLNDFMHPFRDGDEKDSDGYKGCVYITQKSSKKPKLVGKMKEQVEADMFYAGCKARLIVTAMSYEQKGNPGVTFLLDAVQFAGDAPSFGGGGADVSKFDDIVDESADDPASYAGTAATEIPKSAPAAKKASSFLD